jgi:hypothetical protein
MLWIMLPGIPGTISIAVDIAIGIVHKVVAVIDIDSVVSAPAGVPSPSAAPSGSHGHSNAERDGRASGVVSRRGIGNGRIRISWGTVHDGRIVAGNINNFWTRLLYDNHLFAFDDFRFHFLLFR